ncbi:SMP-30/gluconolactonase/LRE family protein [Actinokineospora terrae]|uniref:SMP-30/Gluconolaconase/LRE-like region-containing protein n=1 Tax=Actinokineospora terrae TaxID=155974 RepID=A0A1H9PF08_9PSEU|nr:SMP-30/gluconolactonase/LRE family protein [Actinokineospora terrae]SER46762.1 SMP-30/Gluconolaconase/LRE-like region-containing protein [Actinokineospora terrae]
MAMIRPTELTAGMCVGLLGRRVAGPHWTGRQLSWVDTRADLGHPDGGAQLGGSVQLGRMTPLGPRHVATLVLDGRVTGAVPAEGGWVVGGDPAFLRRDGRVVALDLPTCDGIWCDPAGRLWLDTGHALARVDLGGRVCTVLDGPTDALAWSPDTRTLYRVCDGGLVAHEFDLANGTTGAARRLVSSARGVTTDVDGFAWVAGGNTVRRVDHTGVAYTIVRLTDAVAIGCCFAGSTLLITTADGTVHACAPGTTGAPSVRWTGLPGRGRTDAPAFP